MQKNDNSLIKDQAASADYQTITQTQEDVMTLNSILSDRDLLGKLDGLAGDEEVTQETLLIVLETENAHPQTWTEEKVVEKFTKQMPVAKSRLKRQSGRRIVPRGKLLLDCQANAEQDHIDLVNLDLIEQLPTNLRPVARRLYRGYTRQQTANSLSVNSRTVYRHVIAIQESLLDCIA